MVTVRQIQSETLGTVYELANETQVVRLSPVGARLLDWEIQVNGQTRDIVVGFDTLEQHLKHRYFGATIGPVAGRIKDGHFVLEEQDYQLETTENGHTLHSGALGLDHVTFHATKREDSVVFETTFQDPDQRFPGTIAITVEYTLTLDNQLTITYHATTDKPTLFNPTNHGYFNLLGDPTKAIDTHHLAIGAYQRAEKSADVTTTGEVLDLADTAYDFHHARAIGTVALDDPFLLHHESEVDLHLFSPDEQVELTVATDAPAVILYTTGTHEEGERMKNGCIMSDRGALAIETQGIPGSERYAHFPSIKLSPETPFVSKTTYQLNVIE